MLGVRSSLGARLLASASPNPVSRGATGTVIRYYLPKDGDVRLGIFDVAGREVRRLVATRQAAGQQAAAWDAYINQDSYLSSHRGQYAERNGVLLPMAYRLDFSVAQDLFKNLGGARHTLTFRADFLNFSNLLNHNWGVGQRLVGMNTSAPYATQPLTNVGVDAQGQATYRMRVVNGALMNSSLQPTAGLSDVYQIQFSLKYSFN